MDIYLKKWESQSNVANSSQWKLGIVISWRYTLITKGFYYSYAAIKCDLFCSHLICLHKCVLNKNNLHIFKAWHHRFWILALPLHIIAPMMQHFRCTRQKHSMSALVCLAAVCKEVLAMADISLTARKRAFIIESSSDSLYRRGSTVNILL